MEGGGKEEGGREGRGGREEGGKREGGREGRREGGRREGGREEGGREGGREGERGGRRGREGGRVAVGVQRTWDSITRVSFRVGKPRKISPKLLGNTASKATNSKRSQNIPVTHVLATFSHSLLHLLLNNNVTSPGYNVPQLQTNCYKLPE